MQVRAGKSTSLFLFSRLPSLSAASQREERRLLGGLRMRTPAAVVLVALLSATLGGYPVGDGGGWVDGSSRIAPPYVPVWPRAVAKAARIWTAALPVPISPCPGICPMS